MIEEKYQNIVANLIGIILLIISMLVLNKIFYL